MSRFGDITIDSLPPHAQAKARELLAIERALPRRHPEDTPGTGEEAAGWVDSPRPMRVPKAPQMNKTETAYSLRLDALKRDGQIADWKFGSITLQLAPGLRFTPDFSVVAMETSDADDVYAVLSFVEVKNAFVRDDARAKLLMAARAYPWFRFTLAQLIKGEWHLHEVAR